MMDRLVNAQHERLDTVDDAVAVFFSRRTTYDKHHIDKGGSWNVRHVHDRLS